MESQSSVRDSCWTLQGAVPDNIDVLRDMPVQGHLWNKEDGQVITTPRDSNSNTERGTKERKDDMNVQNLTEDGEEYTRDDEDRSRKHIAWIVDPSEQGPNLTNEQAVV